MSFEVPGSRADTGPEAPAGFVLGAEEGDAYWWLGSLTIAKLRGDLTEGRIDVVDHRVPAGYAPPMHVHRNQDEVFYVIDGEFSIRCGDEQWTAGPGSFVFLPRDTPHGFAVTGDGPARTLLINAPAGFADVVAELGEHAERLELPGPEVAVPPPARIADVSRAHGIHPA